jgi:hypothetical protein
MKIKTHKAYDLCNSWEDSFGVDNPLYLPYWVKYMTASARISYLAEHGKEFTDFKCEMLKPSFNWDGWQHSF